MDIIEGTVLKTSDIFTTIREVDTFRFEMVSNQDDDEVKFEVYEFGNHAHTSKNVLKKDSICRVIGKCEQVPHIDKNNKEVIVNRIYAKTVDYLK